MILSLMLLIFQVKYVTYRRDRQDGRRGGGIVCYVRNNVPCKRVTELERPDVESMWLLYRNVSMPRCVSHVLIGTIYHPPDVKSYITTTYITECLDKITQKHPNVGIVLTGDFNNLNDRVILSFPLKQIVRSATRNNRILDKIYTNISELYDKPYTSRDWKIGS